MSFLNKEYPDLYFETKIVLGDLREKASKVMAKGFLCSNSFNRDCYLGTVTMFFPLNEQFLSSPGGGRGRYHQRRQFMGVTFSIPDFEVDYESECYSRERGCFFEILRNLASF